MKIIYSILMLSVVLTSCQGDKKNQEEKKSKETQEEPVAEKEPTEKPEIVPIQHATFFMKWNQKNIYVDPVGGKEAFDRFPEPDLIFITHIHPDHFSVKTLAALGTNYKIMAPKSVYKKLPKSHQQITKVMNNGDKMNAYGLSVEAIPMYNTTESRKNFHPKGRGNGYKIVHDGYGLYISGDTEVTPAMKNLKGIDHALLCMNLPYTMDYKHAAKGVLEFKPKKVTPYHYRGKKDGKAYFENTEAFKEMVENNSKDIEVDLMDWYPDPKSESTGESQS